MKSIIKLSLIFLGVVEYLSTEISTSKQKKFSLVTFVDTPGLVDGDMKYPFDVDETILWLGRICVYLGIFSLSNFCFGFSIGFRYDFLDGCCQTFLVTMFA